jgi:hypothetical protein
VSHLSCWRNPLCSVLRFGIDLFIPVILHRTLERHYHLHYPGKSVLRKLHMSIPISPVPTHADSSMKNSCRYRVVVLAVWQAKIVSVSFFIPASSDDGTNTYYAKIHRTGSTRDQITYRDSQSNTGLVLLPLRTGDQGRYAAS